MPEPASRKEQTAYEHTDIPILVPVGIMGLVAAVVIGAVLILSGLYAGTMHQPSAAPARLPPKPRLDINGSRAFRQFDDRVMKRLDSYGWVDRRRGLVHIPIALAMQRAAKAGFPDWPGNPGANPPASASPPPSRSPAASAKGAPAPKASASRAAPAASGRGGNTAARPGQNKPAGR